MKPIGLFLLALAAGTAGGADPAASIAVSATTWAPTRPAT